MTFENPEERILWEKIAIGVASLWNANEVSAATRWADKLVEAYRSRRGEHDKDNSIEVHVTGSGHIGSATHG